MEDSINTRILKRLGYFVAEAAEEEFQGTEGVVLVLCDKEWHARKYILPDDYYDEFWEYETLEEFVFSFGPRPDSNLWFVFTLLEGLRWAIEHYPNRAIGKPYQVYIYGDDLGFGEADTLEEAICMAWLDYMERKDRREQRRGKADV